MRELLYTLALLAAVDANATATPTADSYLVVAVPDNYQSDPLSQDLIRGFRSDPTLLALRQRTAYWTYTASNPDWQHRFAPCVKTLPTVMVMQGSKVVYKRSGVGSQQIAREVGGGGFLQQLFRPRIRPNICPGPDCPTQPYQPYEPTDPNQPWQPDQPTGPLTPIDPPAIPDTTPILPPQPIEPTIDHTAEIDQLRAEINTLIARIEVLEKTQPPAGPTGPPGPAGPQGPPGEAIDPTTLAAQLPPVRVEWTQLDGEIIRQSKPLGQPLKFQSFIPRSATQRSQ